MNEEKRKQAKSSRGKTQKSPGDKLKNEESARAAVRKKLRYGKKDNSLSIEERKELRKQVARGRNLIYTEAAINRKSSHELDKHNEDENVGTEAVARGMESSGLVAEKVKLEGYGKKLHKRTQKDSAKREAAKKEAGKEAAKTAQKNKLKRDMINTAQKKKAKETAAGAYGVGKNATSKAGDLVKKLLRRIGKSIAENPKAWLIVLAIILILVIVCAICFSASFLMFGSVEPSVTISSFTADDADILMVESDYCTKEVGLRNRINRTEELYPGYDEYRYDLDEIGHNPYELAAYLTVLYEDYTRNEVQDRLYTTFTAQYQLTTEEIVEIRTRTETRTRWEQRSRVETRTGVREVWDEESQSYVEEEYTYEETVYYWVEIEYEVEVEYEYYILQVTLTNNTLATVVNNMRLSSDLMDRYYLLISTRGNKPYLFGDDIYNVTDPGEYQDYEVPPEYLTDQEFARMLQCAERYLGYPYVWGGSSPTTSFDCSGYVSYVINNCGNGWNVGRQTANGLLRYCTRVSASEAKPGDLIFFEGTYNTTGASHVGIYVGDGMMIHCGNPIQYASINTTYWQDHFYTFARIN